MSAPANNFSTPIQPNTPGQSNAPVMNETPPNLAPTTNVSAMTQQTPEATGGMDKKSLSSSNPTDGKVPGAITTQDHPGASGQSCGAAAASSNSQMPTPAEMDKMLSYVSEKIQAAVSPEEKKRIASVASTISALGEYAYNSDDTWKQREQAAAKELANVRQTGAMDAEFVKNAVSIAAQLMPKEFDASLKPVLGEAWHKCSPQEIMQVFGSHLKPLVTKAHTDLNFLRRYQIPYQTVEEAVATSLTNTAHQARSKVPNVQNELNRLQQLQLKRQNQSLSGVPAPPLQRTGIQAQSLHKRDLPVATTIRANVVSEQMQGLQNMVKRRRMSGKAATGIANGQTSLQSSNIPSFDDADNWNKGFTRLPEY